MYHNVFIHLSTDEHLGDFYILAIVNNSTMNKEVHIFFFQISVLDFFRCPEVKPLGHIKAEVLYYV